MEEILSSIRRIIADEASDEEGEQDAGSRPERQEWAETPAFGGEEGERDDDVLELTEVVREEGEVIDLDRGLAQAHALEREAMDPGEDFAAEPDAGEQESDEPVALHRDLAATARPLALGAAPGGLAATASLAAPDPDLLLLRSGGGREIVELQLLVLIGHETSLASVSSISTRCLTLASMPRSVGESVCSTVWWRRFRPRPWMVALVFGFSPMRLWRRVTLMVLSLVLAIVYLFRVRGDGPQ